MKTSIILILLTLNLSSLTCSAEEVDYFRVLGITRRTRKSEIKRAHRSISKRIHPDKNKDKYARRWAKREDVKCDPKATEKFVLLTKAFETLYDEDLWSLYRFKNPTHGHFKQDYDWDLPKCSNWTDFQDESVEMSWLYSWIRLSLSCITKPASLTLDIAAHLYILLVTSSLQLIMVGVCLYWSSYTVSRNPVYQFFLLFVLTEAVLHVILAVKISTVLPSLLTTWWMTAVALLVVWACYLSVVSSVLEIIMYGISMWNFLYLQNYIVYFVVYTCGAFLLAAYYYRKYPLHNYNRYIKCCSYIHCTVGILLVYFSITHKESAAVVCALIVSFTWFFKKSAPIIMRSLKFMIKMTTSYVISVLKMLCKLLHFFAKILVKVVRVISLPIYTLLELPVTIPRNTWKLFSFLTKCAIHSLLIGMRKVYHFIQTKVFSKSFNQRCPVRNVPTRRLLSKVEYILEGRIETEKQLKELKHFCQSQKGNAWKTALSLQNLERFTSFVNGQDHITEEEKEEHQRTGTDPPQRDESDDNNDDITDDVPDLYIGI